MASSSPTPLAITPAAPDLNRAEREGAVRRPARGTSHRLPKRRVGVWGEKRARRSLTAAAGELRKQSGEPDPTGGPALFLGAVALTQDAFDLGQLPIGSKLPRV